jgi:hypothetical protein
MDMQSSKERSPFIQHPLGLLVLEVLVSERDDPALRDEEGELLFLPRRELVELNTGDFRSKARCQLSSDS